MGSLSSGSNATLDGTDMREQIAILSGGRDRNGGAIITIQQASPAMKEWNQEKFRKVLKFLTTIPSEEVKRHGFTFIIDMRASLWQNVKIILRTLQDNFPFSISCAFVVKLESDKHKSKSSQSHAKYGFEVMIIDVEHLPKYINTSQLTKDLRGSLNYDHGKWVDMRLELNHYIGEASRKIRDLDDLKRTVINIELTEKLESVDGSLDHLKKWREESAQLQSGIEKVEERGRIILQLLGPRTPGVGSVNAIETWRVIAENPDFHSDIDSVRILVDQLHNFPVDLKRAFQQREEKLLQCREFCAFKNRAEQKRIWIRKTRQQFVAGYAVIGTSHSNVKELQQQHNLFQENCAPNFLDISDLIEVGVRLLESGHYAAQNIKSICEVLNQQKNALIAGMRDRSVILSLSARFHERSEEFAKMTPVWMEMCEVEVDLPTKTNALSKLKDQHRALTATIGHFTDVHKCGIELTQHVEHFVAFCCRAFKEHCREDGKTLLYALNGSGQNVGENLTQADADRAVAHVNGVIHNIQAHCKELQRRCKIKDIILDQHLELRNMQENAKTINNWVDNCGMPFLLKTDIGRTADHARSLRQRHSKFEEVCEKTYSNTELTLNYADRLLQTGDSELYFDASEIHNSRQALEKCVNEFRRRVAARATMLDCAIAFYDHWTALMISIEESKKALQVDPPLDTLESVIEAINRHNVERQNVMDCWTHTEHEGNALQLHLRSYSNPISADFEHVGGLLQDAAVARSKLEMMWNPRLAQLELFSKLRIFERSAAESIVDIENWIQSVQNFDEEINLGVAEECLKSLKPQEIHFHNALQQALKRGDDLLEYLGSSDMMNVVDIPSMESAIKSNLEKLESCQNELEDVVYLLTLRLEGKIEARICERRAQEIIHFIQDRIMELRSFPVSLRNLSETTSLFKLYEEIHKDVETLRKKILPSFYEMADAIAQHDEEGSETAVCSIENVNRYWHELQPLSDEMCHTITNGINFYKAVEQVCSVLEPLENEYRIDEDLYSSVRLQGEDPTKWVETRLNRHLEQRKSVLKHCTYVRRTADLFLKHLGRAFPLSQITEAGLRNVKMQVTGLREHVDRLENSVLEHWSIRKRRFEQCREYILVEGFARRYLSWIKEKSEKYLDVRKLSGGDQNSVENLWNEHKEFQLDVKENQDKVRTFMRLANDLLERGPHSHIEQIKSWFLAVDSGQKDFQARMDNYLRHLETKLGILTNTQNANQSDRNSDGSLDGKLQEINSKDSNEEKRKSAKQREYIMTELLQTERAYVKDLGDCIKIYLDEMKIPTSGIPVPSSLASKSSVIFGNIRDIYEFHSQIFLKELEKYDTVPEDLGHCFVTWTPKFDMYVTYCINMDQQHSKAIVASQAAKEYFKEVQSHFSLGLEIGAYLIKPVQRIVKYGQLLEELLKCSEDDRGEIQDGLEVMKNVPKKANDAINLQSLDGFTESFESLGELVLVNGFQIWDKQSSVAKINWKSQERQVFLFESAILLAKATGNPQHPRFAFKDKLMTTGLGISEHVDGDECKFMIWLSRTSQPSQPMPSSSDSKIVFKAQSLDAKQTWISKLREVVQHNYVNTSLNAALITGSKGTRANRGNRDSKDFEDSLSLDDGSGSHERYSIISHSSSTTTDSDKILFEGDCATVVADYVAANDGEISLEKGECVEVLDRTSSGDFCLVRVKAGASVAYHKTPTVSSQRITEGYIPVTILALIPNNHPSRHLSPSRTTSMEGGPNNQDGFGSNSTASLPVICQSVSGSQSGDTTPTVITVQPTSKRRNTFKKWLTNPVRKLSQNRIEMGSSSAGKQILPPTSTASLAVPATAAGGNQGAAKKMPPIPSSVPSASASSRVKSLFQSHAQSSVVSSSSPPEDARRASAPPGPPLAQQEDLQPEDDHINLANKSASASAPVSANVSLDVVAANEPANAVISADSCYDNSGLVSADLPPEMLPLDFQPATQEKLFSPSSSSLTPPPQLPSSNNQVEAESSHNQTELESVLLVISPTKASLSSPVIPPPDSNHRSVVISSQTANMMPASPSSTANEYDSKESQDESTVDSHPEDKSVEESETTIEEVVAEPVDPVLRAITMRDYVLKELVDTERDYVKDLGLICEGYIACMHENPLPDDMNGREKIIFGNVQQIYVFHRDTFCGELEKCLDAADRLPQVFIRFERKFQMYVVYCQNKPKSEFIVSEYLDTYFEDIRLKLGQKLQLPDMLIKPVQRVMRYQLMLKDILKYTERAQLPATELHKAFKCIMGVCKLANDFMKVGRLQGFEHNLSAQGKLLLQEGFLVCETTSGSSVGQGKDKDKDKDKDNQLQNNKFKERQIFLFEQVVIFSETVGQSQHNKKSYVSPVYLYKGHIQVNKMSLIEVDKDHVRFALRSRCPHSGDRMFVIEAPDQEKRDLWVAQIKAMLDNQQNFLRALQSPIDFQRRAQQGDDGTTMPGLAYEDSPQLYAGSSSRPPLSAAPSKASNEIVEKRSSEKKFTRFLRPKSYTDDRRRTVSVPPVPETPVIRSHVYSGSVTTPITPPAVDDIQKPPELAISNTISGKSSRFLFPPALKVVHSEADLLRKSTLDSTSSVAKNADSKTSLDVPEQSESSSSRRWSISGRRDRPPTSASSQTKESPRSGLSFRRKN